VSASSAPRAQQGGARPHLCNESCLDSQDGVIAGRWFGRWRMKKRKMETDCHRSQRPQRGDRRYHSNCEGTNRTRSLRLGKNSVRRPLSLAARVTGRHHGASALVRHVVATLPFRGSHCRSWKDARHRWRDCPQKGDRQQHEGSDPSHPHECTASADCQKQR